ncbi:cellulose biosynthesis cyclic di-GMP-binding regulatory protein BcsB [Rhizobium sp. EC-SD404]|uniref:cellulose biosynthesis cyclic di-GMP-binding regulatory protein BcsB n=1 Tax=Rhizobium sp. EC-SD404 TaxID=2038389 RepID=UPI00125C98D8|nr:cellulose biosynthesis cyclic di-GMP-binding regulatory protein BcsB [Rhizobium sp. EC-SD404]VVT14756.1 Cellulose synthase subunit [Rhizobium sp. EC-SD404]
MTRAAIALVAMLCAVDAHAQGTPFDMSPERPAVEEDVAPEPLPPVPATPEPTTPEPAPPEPATPEPAEQPSTTAPNNQSDADLAEPAPPAPETSVDADTLRYLLPEPMLRLNGEGDRRNWAVYLTEAQAASPVRLNVGYRNAVVVAPEASRLSVSINGVSVLHESIQAPGDTGELTVDLAAGLLQPGRNELSVQAIQRHRTDCSIESTYELWTELDGARTFLAFPSSDEIGLTNVEDLRALSGDMNGSADIAIIAPVLASSDIGAELLRLTQAIALSSNFPDPQFSIATTDDGLIESPDLRVFAGAAADIAEMAGIDATQIGGPTLMLVDGESGASPILIVTGQNQQEWLTAVTQIAQQVDRPAGAPREFLSTEATWTPNAPMIYEGRSISFADLGIGSEQFAGRRYARSFQFAVPSDFYAGSYGQARILLDAAYTGAVLPGGLINVYVNGNIATSVAMTARRGAVLRQFPIKVTMEHFKPGVNTVLFEVDLLTRDDEVCAPGATTDTTPRFAIFDTSQFVLPDFARIGQIPNLAAVAGTGYPYNQAQEPVPLVIGRGSTASLSAAANFMARMSLASGRIVPTQLVMSAEIARDQNAIFFGTPASIAGNVLTQVGIDAQAATSWAPARSTGQIGSPDAGEPAPVTMEAWRGQMQAGWIARTIESTRNWASETFNITGDMLRFAPQEDAPFVPAEGDTMVVAQSINPSGTGTWTVVTAPDEAGMQLGARELVRSTNWDQLAGHLTVFTADGLPGRVLNSSRMSLIESQPPSFFNYRLIVANWLSSNILSYALALVFVCIIVGATTSGLLSRLGRRR